MRVPSKAVNLYLVGFMGVGKTAVGRALAQQLDLEFLDSDREIEIQQHRQIKEIFETCGEATFRNMEREFIANGHPPTGCVVACGGGLIIPPGMLDFVRTKGVVVCLFADPETIIKRTATNDKRPLLNGGNPEERVRKLYAERMPIYNKVRTAISTDNQSIREIVRRLEAIYHRESRDFQLRTS
ncbi:MAG: shikimate kinase [Verrucomicrobiota bacterium]|nr:shikimate kinase [Verrucomicrobiota bacterium]